MSTNDRKDLSSSESKISDSKYKGKGTTMLEVKELQVHVHVQCSFAARTVGLGQGVAHKCVYYSLFTLSCCCTLRINKFRTLSAMNTILVSLDFSHFPNPTIYSTYSLRTCKQANQLFPYISTGITRTTKNAAEVIITQLRCGMHSMYTMYIDTNEVNSEVSPVSISINPLKVPDNTT